MNNPYRLRSLVLALTTLLAGSAVFSQTARDLLPLQVPSEELLAQFPKMTGFRLSPDGKHMLAIESTGDVRNILVWKTDKLADKPTVIGSNSMRVRSASFLKNDMLAVTLWQPYDARIGEVTKTFIEKLLVTDLDGKVWKEPLEAADIARTDAARRLKDLAKPTIKSKLGGDPDHVIVESDGLGTERDLFRYNVRTGVSTRVVRLGENDLDIVLNGAGAPIAKTRGGSDSKGFFVATELRNAATGNWEEHFRSYVKDRDVVEVLGPGLTPDTVVLRSSVGRNVAGLYEYDVTKRQVTGTLFEHKFFEALDTKSLGNENTGADAKAYDGYTYQGLHGTEVHWDNPKYESVIKGVAKALGIAEISQPLVDVKTGQKADVKMLDGVDVTITGFVDGEVPTYLIKASGLTYPTEHYLLRGQKFSLLAREWPQLDRRTLGKAQFVYYKARDGLNIPAFLTTPNAQLCGAGPYKAVVLPHGGPWSRDTMEFDSSGWVSMLVSRCHVVLQPQYRGSAGWGRALWMAGDAEWGQKMQDDKDDGAQWLIDQKLANPQRIAMFGFSYGGYAAFAAAVRPNGYYKCAIAGAGVSDIEKIWAKFYTNPFYRDRQEPTVKGLSPVREASNIKIPIMVYHGERDQTVPVEQSEMFVDRARKSSQPVEYHLLKDYAHGPAWTREIMTNQLKLISNYLSTGCGGKGL